MYIYIKMLFEHWTYSLCLYIYREREREYRQIRYIGAPPWQGHKIKGEKGNGTKKISSKSRNLCEY